MYNCIHFMNIHMKYKYYNQDKDKNLRYLNDVNKSVDPALWYLEDCFRKVLTRGTKQYNVLLLRLLAHRFVRKERKKLTKKDTWEEKVLEKETCCTQQHIFI